VLRQHRFRPIESAAALVSALGGECAVKDGGNRIHWVSVSINRMREFLSNKRGGSALRVLSKSKLLAYRQCPKRLWLEVHRPDLREDSSATQASFAVGHQVGDIARQLYDPKGKGVLIDPQVDGFEAAFARTQELSASELSRSSKLGFAPKGH
jgi:hypothetical protein